MSLDAKHFHAFTRDVPQGLDAPILAQFHQHRLVETFLIPYKSAKKVLHGRVEDLHKRKLAEHFLEILKEGSGEKMGCEKPDHGDQRDSEDKPDTGNWKSQQAINIDKQDVNDIDRSEDGNKDEQAFKERPDDEFHNRGSFANGMDGGSGINSGAGTRFTKKRSGEKNSCRRVKK